MSVIIREMTSEEYPLLEDFLYNAVFLPPGADPVPRDIIFEPEIYIYIDGFGSKQGDYAVTAMTNGNIAGAAWTRIIPAYGHVDEDTPELAISVLPQYRGQGIGTMMMTHLFELLREHGYSRTSLSVQKDNPAVRFYKRLGYKITGEKTDHANHEDYIMIKEIGVNLRSWKIEDAPELAAAINNKNILDNVRDGIPFPYTEKDAVEFINATLAAEKGTQYAFAITYNGKVIGSIGAFRKENVHRLTAEMGYYIAEPYWGKGLMTEAVKQACAYIFENTDIIRIFAQPYANNTASCRVLEKAEFQFEGVLRKNAVKNGQMMDMRMYAVIKG
ncbi:MAG: GNAT family N-acetyltransferase [Chitinispirillales bacterium]|jgi:RimJ/RimL family protein N-acetyltransferase|nr:GNAT family N-acetyltransferase [Chitinispirillales bacterium]